MATAFLDFQLPDVVPAAAPRIGRTMRSVAPASLVPDEAPELRDAALPMLFLDSDTLLGADELDRLVSELDSPLGTLDDLRGLDDLGDMGELAFMPSEPPAAPTAPAASMASKAPMALKAPMASKAPKAPKASRAMSDAGPKTKKARVAVGCSCTHGCTKLYCACFRAGVACDPDICGRCTKMGNCCNTTDAPKPRASRKSFCNCKKSGCIVNYCECRLAGRSCGPMCGCPMGCGNCADKGVAC